MEHTSIILLITKFITSSLQGQPVLYLEVLMQCVLENIVCCARPRVRSAQIPIAS
eukprot:SAG31_NODE_40375_length_281_cov_0.824176_1_plen_54_part_01